MTQTVRLRVVGWGRLSSRRRSEEQRYARAWEQAGTFFDALERLDQQGDPATAELDDPVEQVSAGSPAKPATLPDQELRSRADAGDKLAEFQLAALLARRGDPEALAELRSRADAGDESAQRLLADLLIERGDPEALAELRSRADAGDVSADHRLLEDSLIKHEKRKAQATLQAPEDANRETDDILREVLQKLRDERARGEVIY